MAEAKNSLIERAKNRGIRFSAQRLLICQVLEASDDHPDVDTIYARAKATDTSISVASVYRTVKVLHDLGLIIKHDFGDGRGRVEVNTDEHHDHLVDIDTGRVIEFHDEDLEVLQEQIARRLGYELEGHTLALFGRSITD